MRNTASEEVMMHGEFTSVFITAKQESGSVKLVGIDLSVLEPAHAK